MKKYIIALVVLTAIFVISMLAIRSASSEAEMEAEMNLEYAVKAYTHHGEGSGELRALAFNEETTFVLLEDELDIYSTENGVLLYKFESNEYLTLPLIKDILNIFEELEPDCYKLIWDAESFSLSQNAPRQIFSIYMTMYGEQYSILLSEKDWGLK